MPKDWWRRFEKTALAGNFFSLAVIVLCYQSLLIAQALLMPISDAEIRPLMLTAVKTGGGDQAKTMNVLDKAVKARFGDVLMTGFGIGSNVTLAGLFPPYVQYRINVRESVRKLLPVDALVFPDSVELLVEPDSIDLPNIEKVLVYRAQQIIEPISSTFAPHEFKNRFGAAFTRNSGEIFFPTSAFAPGAVVKIVLIPEQGPRNFETILDPKTLARFR